MTERRWCLWCCEAFAALEYCPVCGRELVVEQAAAAAATVAVAALEASDALLEQMVGGVWDEALEAIDTADGEEREPFTCGGCGVFYAAPDHPPVLAWPHDDQGRPVPDPRRPGDVVMLRLCDACVSGLLRRQHTTGGS